MSHHKMEILEHILGFASTGTKELPGGFLESELFWHLNANFQNLIFQAILDISIKQKHWASFTAIANLLVVIPV